MWCRARGPRLYAGCCRRRRADAAAYLGRHQRAAGVPLLPTHLQLLLLAEAPLPGQARAVGHAVRVRVLPPPLPHQELADDAQEPAASRLQRHAQASAQDLGHQERAGAAAPATSATAAAAMTTAAAAAAAAAVLSPAGLMLSLLLHSGLSAPTTSTKAQSIFYIKRDDNVIFKSLHIGLSHVEILHYTYEIVSFLSKMVYNRSSVTYLAILLLIHISVTSRHILYTNLFYTYTSCIM